MLNTVSLVFNILFFCFFLFLRRYVSYYDDSIQNTWPNMQVRWNGTKYRMNAVTSRYIWQSLTVPTSEHWRIFLVVYTIFSFNKEFIFVIFYFLTIDYYSQKNQCFCKYNFKSTEFYRILSKLFTENKTLVVAILIRSLLITVFSWWIDKGKTLFWVAWFEVPTWRLTYK